MHDSFRLQKCLILQYVKEGRELITKNETLVVPQWHLRVGIIKKAELSNRVLWEQWAHLTFSRQVITYQQTFQRSVFCLKVNTQMKKRKNRFLTFALITQKGCAPLVLKVCTMSVCVVVIQMWSWCFQPSNALSTIEMNPSKVYVMCPTVVACYNRDVCTDESVIKLFFSKNNYFSQETTVYLKKITSGSRKGPGK